MVLGIAYNRYSPATGFHFSALGDALGSVVSALGLEVGTDFSNDGAHVVLGKDHNCVYIGEGREYFRAFVGWHKGTTGAFESTHGIVGVDRHDELPAQFTRGAQVADMAYVQQIEASVGECNARAGAPPFGHALPKLVA